jgi:hypothetical protein
MMEVTCRTRCELAAGSLRHFAELRSAGYIRVSLMKPENPSSWRRDTLQLRMINRKRSSLLRAAHFAATARRCRSGGQAINYL